LTYDHPADKKVIKQEGVILHLKVRHHITPDLLHGTQAKKCVKYMHFLSRNDSSNIDFG